MSDDLRTTVLIPTLWRSHHIAPMLEALFANTTIPLDILFLVQADDEKTIVEVARSGFSFLTFPSVDGEPETMVNKVNEAFAQVRTPFFIGLSDDVRVQPGCLEAAHAALADGTNHLACLNDGIRAHLHEDGELTGHVLARTSYIAEQSGVMDAPATVMHPGYKHFYSDMELWQVGKARGCYVSCFDARIDHPNPNDGTAEMDEVHRWTRRHMGADRDLFISRMHQWAPVEDVPALSVVVAGVPSVRYTGDSEWFWDCPTCGDYVMGFSKGEAIRLADLHNEKYHEGMAP